MSLRIAMVGAGGISDVHLMAFSAHPKVTLSAIVDPDLTAAKIQAQKYGARSVIADYRQVLEDPSIDVIDIAVPHFLHCQITLDALASGKHVICEKPIGLNLEDADRMIAAAKHAKGRLLIKKYQRCGAHHTKVKEVIDSGQIGDVFLAQGTFIGQQLGWENDPENWRGTWNKAGGGSLIDSGIHLVDLMQFILGKALAVTATTKRLVADFPEKADDTSSICIEYANNSVANILCTNADTSLAESNWTKTFFGTKGSLNVFMRDGITYVVKHANGASVELVKLANWWEITNIEVVTHLVDCLLNNQEPIASLAEARHDLEIVLTAYQASTSGQRIEIGKED